MTNESKTLVVYSEKLLLEEQRNQLRARMQDEFPDMRVAIVDGGVKVAVVGKFNPTMQTIEDIKENLAVIASAIDNSHWDGVLHFREI